MATEILYEKIKRELEDITPSLALLESEGISLKEAKEKLMELLEKSREAGAQAEDLEGRLFYINYFFEGWLHYEKGLSEEKASALSSPVSELLRERLREKQEKRELGREAKIIQFPEKRR